MASVCAVDVHGAVIDYLSSPFHVCGIYRFCVLDSIFKVPLLVSALNQNAFIYAVVSVYHLIPGTFWFMVKAELLK
jgi:hypothetical protein